ncbi:hypothetical protein ACFY12_29815 [Streptomyces sp. NPDC001339]|uniref:hypothetical protein n=1 Tax=Streptomyces sp. NPDC001339 TaxID=3364563 RepID=UPI0036B4FD9C
MTPSSFSAAVAVAPTNRHTSPHGPLRRILALDAAGMLVFGLAYLLAPTPLAELLGVGEKLVLTSGGLMLTIGMGVAVLAGRTHPPAAWVWLVIAIGALWVAASVASLVLNWWDTNAIGTAWTTLQAIPVSVFTILQFAALRRRGRP